MDKGRTYMTDSVPEEILYKRAFLLALFTVFYNIIEGVVSIYFGYSDETLALMGFGADSIIEVMSGLGITVMILRIQRNKERQKSRFEVTALRITGWAFYILAVSLMAGIIINILTRHKPETTIWGIIISLVSIIVMVWLMNAKKRTGTSLGSEPIIADSNCTRICVYMSVVLLLSSLIYEFTGFAYADAIGTAGLIYFSYKEGRESFEKARGKECNCTR